MKNTNHKVPVTIVQSDSAYLWWDIEVIPVNFSNSVIKYDSMRCVNFQVYLYKNDEEFMGTLVFFRRALLTYLMKKPVFTMGVKGSTWQIKSRYGIFMYNATH